jgi:hypothetical protein
MAVDVGEPVEQRERPRRVRQHEPLAAVESEDLAGIFTLPAVKDLLGLPEGIDVAAGPPLPEDVATTDPQARGRRLRIR